MKKGVTPIVAVVMLLLIVIALVGGVFVWMRGTMGTLQKKGTQQITGELKKSDQTVTIQSIDCSDTTSSNSGNDVVYIKHTGDKYAINTTKLDVFKNNGYKAVTWEKADGTSLTGPIDPQQTVRFESFDLNDGGTVRIVAPGNEDSKSISGYC